VTRAAWIRVGVLAALAGLGLGTLLAVLDRRAAADRERYENPFAGPRRRMRADGRPSSRIVRFGELIRLLEQNRRDQPGYFFKPLKAPGLLLAVRAYGPGQFEPLHVHRAAEEWMFLAGGSSRLAVAAGGSVQSVAVGRRGLIRVGPGRAHGLEGTAADDLLIVIGLFSPPGDAAWYVRAPAGDGPPPAGDGPLPAAVEVDREVDAAPAEAGVRSLRLGRLGETDVRALRLEPGASLEDRGLAPCDRAWLLYEGGARFRGRRDEESAAAWTLFHAPRGTGVRVIASGPGPARLLELCFPYPQAGFGVDERR
jgi:hypothetical protein